MVENQQDTQIPNQDSHQGEIRKHSSLKKAIESRLSPIRERTSNLFAEVGEGMRQRWKDLSFKRKELEERTRKKIETGEDLRNFLAEIKGKQIDKAARGGVVGVPPSLLIGMGSGLLKEELLASGFEVAGAAPLAAVSASLARDTLRIYRAYTNDQEVIATLAARYVQKEPEIKPARSDEERGRMGVKEKIVGGLAKTAWWTQIVERTAVEAITKKGLEEIEEKHSGKILKLLDSKVQEMMNEGKDVREYLSDPKRIRKDINLWLKEAKITDRTKILIETFGFLTDAKTLNSYRDILHS